MTDAGEDVHGEATRPVVLYLGGLGRSGSTLLERLVGETPGVAGLGEVVHLWERGIQADEQCACGQAFHSCSFWTAVGDQAYGGWDHVDVAAVESARARVDRNRHVPRVAAGLLSKKDARVLDRYTKLHARLYAAAANVAGAEVVVDSSKHASLAWCLAQNDAVDLRLVHVVRDSPGVAWSWAKDVARPEAAGERMTQWGPIRTSLEWDVQNTLFLALGRVATVLVVRYEELVADPVTVLAQVLGHAGLSRPMLRAADVVADDGTFSLSRNHSVAGNPMRFRLGATSIREDTAWRDHLDRSDRLVVQALTFPVRRKLGYPT